MEEYMMKTREDYGTRLARPKFDKDTRFELKGQFLKELHEHTFSGSENEDANEHIERVLEIVDLFTTLDVTQDQLMLRIFPITLTGVASRCAPDAKKAIQEMVDYSQKWHDGTFTRSKSSNTSDGLVAIQAQLKNLGMEIKKVNERVYADLGASVSVMPYSTFTNLGLGKLAHTKLIIEFADNTMKRPKGIAENVLVGIDKFVFLVDFIVLDMPEDIKIPFILRRPYLFTTHAKIDVFKRKFALRIRNDKIVFKSDSPISNIIKKVYVLGLREQMELDLEARLTGDPKFRDFLELNNLNEPLELN
ncbi:putative reverse transcriptase domain-containing protein, partial [Tanacetum coccineum]